MGGGWRSGGTTIPSQGWRGCTFVDDEWDGDNHPSFDNDSYGLRSLPRRSKKSFIAPTEPLQQYEKRFAQHRGGRAVKKIAPEKKDLWNNEALKQAFDVLDGGYKIQDVSKNFGILRSIFRKHYFGKRKSRLIDPQSVLTMAKEEQIAQYLEEWLEFLVPSIQTS